MKIRVHQSPFLIQAARKYNGFNRPTESHSQIITGNIASLFPPTFCPLICENNSYRIGLAHSKETFPWKSLPRQNWALKLKYILLPIITLGHQCYPLKSSYELLSKECLSSSYKKGRPFFLDSVHFNQTTRNWVSFRNLKSKQLMESWNALLWECMNREDSDKLFKSLLLNPRFLSLNPRFSF